ncbi:MAG: hypothetical protein Q9213_003253 [Squamulea squamosa]
MNFRTTIQRSLRTFALVHNESQLLSRTSLQTAFRDAANGEIVILHIALQNSGLIIQKKENGYVIETFEASPPSADVLAAQGALQWDFPSRAVVIPFRTFEDNSLQFALAEFLEKASVEPVKQYDATTLKAGSNAYESRDTTFPAMIGQLLLTILEALGCKHTPILTRKRIRDEVCWNDGAENPWRRSPTWLVLRFFMCFLMSSLCHSFSTQESSSSERLMFARTKLARRVTKLQAQAVTSSPEVSTIVQSLFNRVGKSIFATLRSLESILEDRGIQMRIRHTKKMCRLPKRADPASTTLSLQHSRGTLLQILSEVYYGQSRAQAILPTSQSRVARYSTWVKCIPLYDQISTTDFYCLTDMENQLVEEVKNAHQAGHGVDLDNAVIELGRQLEIYQSRAYNAYKEDPEQLSLMILTLMEVWIGLDSLAVRRYPLLVDYDTGFPSDLLHPLKLAKICDMHRVIIIEEYLEQRRRQADFPLSNMFGDPTKSCFAVRYFDQCEAMQQLCSDIWKANESAKTDKERDLTERRSEYEALLKEHSRLTCLFMEDPNNPLRRQHDVRRCRKCYLGRVARRMRIEIHEDLLPADDIQAKAVVFELLLPSGFAVWRDSLWQLLTLGQPNTIPDQNIRLLLRGYEGLKRFAQSTHGSITLASRTKSFHQTHYNGVPFPVQLDQVCLPHGLKYGTLDPKYSLWTSRHLVRPNFASICAAHLPSESAWSSVKQYTHPTFEDLNPSANEIIANQTRCPNNLTIAEFTSFQDLRVGTRIQWIKLLRELASANINFGTIEITTLVAELALGVGPPEDGHVLRATHWVFRYEPFCQALSECIRRRLQTVATNWHEGQIVECLLVLVQRLWSLGQTEEANREGQELMLLVRHTTHNWLQLLRREICNAVHIETAQKRSQESLHAALLCRKTFMLEAARPDLGFQHNAFACFLECAFTIKDNLSSSEPGYINKMPAALRRLYVSDLKLQHSLDPQIRWSLQNLQSAVTRAVNSVWMDAESPSAPTFSKWTILPAPHDTWCTAQSLGGEGILEQSIQFNFLDGTLYIDGQLLGRLPEEFAKQEFFQQFFGNRIFLTRPSYLPAMSYMFVNHVEGHEIHFGFRNGYRFMRVRPRSSVATVLEFLPSSIFLGSKGAGAPDLPIPLVHNCVHWLDLQTQTVEIRPYATMWRSKDSDWKITLTNSKGVRRNKSELVDPRSPVFHRIAQLIEPFEHRNYMVVYQPLNLKSNLTVNLPGLELTFRVSFDGLLESRQLRAYVDMNQDAGTLYGLKSSLVLRDSILQDNRSILVAMGPATIERTETHVSVAISHSGYYARFLINQLSTMQLLGRLECAAEPRLLYFKAYCHAITSAVHPDPLTSKTGTQEALLCLRAANAQPWAPLDPEAYRILVCIADLTPPRVYYPENLKVLQKVSWDNKVMPGSQSGDFRPLVQDILHQCADLHHFHLDSGTVPTYDRQGDPHLHHRALLRAQNFQPVQFRLSEPSPVDTEYVPRDLGRVAGCKDAYEAAALTWKWCLAMHIDANLYTRLREWPLIQGYIHKFDAHLLSGLINFEPAPNWGSLFRFCCEVEGEEEKAKLIFLFGTLAFGGQIDITLLRSLIAITIMEESKDLQLPQCTEFIRFRRNQIPTVELLAQYIGPHAIPYPDDERALLATAMHGKQRRRLELAQREYEEVSQSLYLSPSVRLATLPVVDNPVPVPCSKMGLIQTLIDSILSSQASEAECKTLANHLLSQWPLREPTINGLPNLHLLDVHQALNSVRPEWERLSDNFQLSEHLSEVQRLLDRCKAPHESERKIEVDTGQHWYASWKPAYVRPCVVDLLYRPLKELPTIDGNIHAKQTSSQTQWATRLRRIITTGQDLGRSLFALQQKCDRKSDDASLNTLRVDSRVLNEEISSTRKELQDKLEFISEAMVIGCKWLKIGGLLPVLTPLTVLQTLRNGARVKNQGTIQAHLLSYAESLVNLQQLLRIQDAHRLDDKIQLASERGNVAHTCWKPEDHIDWLLLEIDFNLIIREDQLQVAQAMIASPSTTNNFVLQMNMGQGKSSVIIPMVATALAKDENLVRVVVPRSLLLQAAQLLSSRLGGLINRKIKHIPFSRKSPTDFESIKAYRELHRDILKSRGVLLALPEHLLSFQLSGLQELSNGHLSESISMIKLQAWFARKARDILDECDHMLAVKTQLIYPSGAQSPVDGHPNRWKLVQGLLKLAKIHFTDLRHEYPRSMEIIDRIPGAFPIVYFLDQGVKDIFMVRLTDSVLRGDGGLLPIQECSKDELALVADLLHHAQFAKATAAQVSQVFKNKKDTRLQLLILRGLLVHKILLMGLSKRWNVQYGIHPLRDPVAVPFRSKGIPSDQAEFGHPDVSILLTCLSFYNTGLTFNQFRQSLGFLLKSDEPVREFESWTSEAHNFPESLSSWASINIDDETQCTALWNHLRLQMAVINSFLNHFVFPRHAKTLIESLLALVGWDIATPLRANKAIVEERLKENEKPAPVTKRPVGGVATALTVGFSGTNDNKTLLPLNVLQNDLPGLSHTNAEVLTYLLQPRNRGYVPATDRRGRRISETAFLHMLHNRGIRMLLDAGAQIIELDNFSLAKTWLTVDTEAEAAVYFGKDERARVVYRDGKNQPLAASPFLDNLGACVVYLDEAHTRGVDLKMPPGAVAALTLGAMQTKDHTVQAAMRLRQLAISQSVIFFAPPEVHQSILNTCKGNREEPVDSHDVIVWLLEQTCCNIEQLQPLYVSQGLEYCRRRIAAQRYEDTGYDASNTKPYLKVLEQPERYSLEELYAPNRKIKAVPIDSSGNAEITGFVKKLNLLKAEIRNTGDTVQALAHEEVEQEREVAIEVETVREVKKPPHAQACCQPPLHRDVKSFAETGRLPAGSHACVQAFVLLRKTAVGRRLGISDSATRSSLYVTQDFSNTVVPEHSALPRDEYSRPAHWVLWSTASSTALIVSDYEANALIPLLRECCPPVTHLISYAAPTTKAMVIFDSLDFFTIPRLPPVWRAPAWLVRDLGIFAGRTYFDYDKQYVAVCEALGLPPSTSKTADLGREMPLPSSNDVNKPVVPFSPSPLLFMQEWLAVRRKGQDFSQTMMGEICQGRRLDKPDAREVKEEGEMADEELLEQGGVSID